MNPYYVAGQLFGAIIAVTILSRILFLGTKGWPLSAWKLIYINMLSAIISILLTIIGSAVSGGGMLIHIGQAFAIYGLKSSGEDRGLAASGAFAD
jgi:hypothetical protein